MIIYMNYHKYIKYKSKYISLKNLTHSGGGKKCQIILFGDVMTGHDVWFNDEFGNKTDFVQKLSKIGNIIVLKPKYVNFMSLSATKNPHDLNRFYKTNDDDIFFHLGDLQFENYSDWVYTQIEKDVPYYRDWIRTRGTLR